MVRRRIAGQCLAALIVFAASAATTAADTVLLDFSSPTCGPCRRMRPIVQQLTSSGYRIREVDVSREPQIASHYGVSSVPTFIVLVDGQERARLTGATSREQLVEMIAKSEEISAARQANVRAQSPDGIAAAQFDRTPSGFDSGADLHSPQAGRIVELEPPSNDYATPASFPPRANNPFPPSAPAASAAPAGSYADQSQLTAATVRLSVEDAQGKSTGTGTIVDARSGEALVLTCGHIFRESQGRGRIEVTLFDGGPQGAVKRDVVEGRLVDFDLDRDLALVSIWINAPVQVAPIAPATAAVRPTEPVTTMGCSRGADPTPQQTRVTSIDRYTGHPNVQVAGAPVEGRSGGGLFNAAGQVVGVCFAADPQGNEGLYSGLPSIHAKLDELRLTAVYQQPSTGQGSVQQASTLAAEPQVRGQDPAAGFPAMPPAPLGSSPMTVPPTGDSFAAAPAGPMGDFDVTPTAGGVQLSAVEQATLEELANRGGKSEVICIIRPQQAGGKSEVITVSGASPAFVNALQSAAAAGGSVRR
ncbi:MAG: trypsin-like peptidase domain-containing protein [Planctomycetales bacterium]|nr:trypsin-like peptidase domain-containing protein [Planctomycetales bacterium]